MEEYLFYPKKNKGFGIFSLLFWLMSGISATTWIIFINIFIWLGLFISSLFLGDGFLQLLNYFALNPSNILGGKYIWTILVHMFTHISFFHLFVNMFVLFSLGRLCERIIGRKRFIWFYLISGVFAGVLSVVLSGFFGSSALGMRIFGVSNIYMVGASGAIFAIAGLYVILLPKLRFGILFVPFFSLPGYIMIPGFLIVVWAISAIFNWPVGNVAHFGGFISGIIYGIYLRQKYKKKVALLQERIR